MSSSLPSRAGEYAVDKRPTAINRRKFLVTSAAGGWVGWSALQHASSIASATTPDSELRVQTVLGPVAPEKLGATLMHEHAPIVDWSELYETRLAPWGEIREAVLTRTATLLDAFHRSLGDLPGPGAVVETTPIRVGRDPQLLVDLAKRTQVHIVASTGFWCEALAPQHPWATRLSVERDGAEKMAELFIREITSGMEDPNGKWGERFTNIRAGIIKIGTSSYLRPSEVVCHKAAAIASQATGCPITTHTTQGGGLEQAQLLLQQGVKPERIIIGHQGFRDDREQDDAGDYHRLLAGLGCYVQFDRVGHDKYTIASQAQQIKRLLDRGFIKQILVSHDHAPYVCQNFTAQQKTVENCKQLEADYTIVRSQLAPALIQLGVSPADLYTMLVENPKRALAF
jgi:phosphotriesterase-related protein